MANHFMHVWWVRDDATIAIRQAASVAVIFGYTEQNWTDERTNEMSKMNERKRGEWKKVGKKMNRDNSTLSIFFFKKNKPSLLMLKFYF